MTSANAHILVVDDDPTIRLLARKSLVKSNFKVIEARNGEECLSLYQEHKIDLVMLDVEMPKLDGHSTCIKLRKHLGAINVPILMVTGLDDDLSINRAFEAGATDFITKPINWGLLCHRLRYMLRNSQLVAELAHSRSSLNNAQRLAKLGSWDWHLSTNKVQGSEELYRLLGAEPHAIPANLNSILALTKEQDKEKVKTSVLSVLKTGTSSDIKYTIQCPDGGERIIYQQVIAIPDNQGRIKQLQGTLQDITARQQAEEQIRHLAYYDNLTNLPNRQMFQITIKKLLEMAQQNEQKLTIFFLDVDNFKRINDTLGHTIGDLFLKSVADKLLSFLSNTNGHITTDESGYSPQQITYLARFGGDEFILAYNNLPNPDQASNKAQQLLTTLADPVKVAGHQLSVSASIGIAMFPQHGTNEDELLRSADIAMHQAKRSGKNTYQFFHPSMNKMSMQRLALENELQKALVNNEFYLVFQPQLDLATGQIVGAETLIRWHNAQFGHISPAEFIPLAEESGIIVELGEWVLKEACKQIKSWHQQGLSALRIAINLSPRQFTNPNLLQQIITIIEDTGFDPHYLELEITESLLMQNVEQAIKTMQQLKALGIKLAIDDFGTGYSSLSYLQRFPIDRLKIDQSFVRDIPSRTSSIAIAQAIIIMAHSLNLSVIAEGVETKSQQAFLINKACDEIQGYYISKPLLPSDFYNFSQQQKYCTAVS